MTAPSDSVKAMGKSRKLPIGSQVAVMLEPGSEQPTGPAEVVAHGRDAGGIYTLVRFEDGRVEQFHREWLTPWPPK